MVLEIGLLAIGSFVVFLVIGLFILIFIVGSLLRFLPATVMAILVLLVTGSLFWAGAAFVFVAILMLALR